MGTKQKFMQQFSLTRRKFLGSVLVGAGAFFSACNMKSLGERATNKGYIILDRIPSYPPGLRDDGDAHKNIRKFINAHLPMDNSNWSIMEIER
jgi:hypothetical protein